MRALSFVCLLLGLAAAAANENIPPSYVSWGGLYMHWRTSWRTGWIWPADLDLIRAPPG